MNQGQTEAQAHARPRVHDPDVEPRMRIVSGDDQTAKLVMADVGFAVATFGPVAVELLDADGSPLAGEPVAWSVGETPGRMGVQLDPMGTSPCIVLTDEHGVATLDKMRGGSATAFYDWGAFTLVASYQGVSAAARLLVAEPAVLRPKIVSGDNQSVARSGDRVAGGEATFGPVRILLKDTEGGVGAGVPVEVEAIGPKGMTIRLSDEGATATVVSDAAGMVTLDLLGGNSMVCRGAAGEFKVVVTPAGTKPVVSHHTVES